MKFDLAVEGIVDEAVGRAVLRYCGHQIGTVRGRKGKGWIDTNLRALLQSQAPVLIIRDMDDDAPCASALKLKLKAVPSKVALLRFPVRKIEAWILADAGGISRYFRIPEKLIPRDVDAIVDPKDLLFRLGSKPIGNRKTVIFRDAGDYTTRLIEFVNAKWSVAEALKQNRSQSLARAVSRLK